VKGVLAGLPESLDETYERILQQIPNPNRAHTHRLLQCLVVAAYPLDVEELAEVLAIDFSATGMTPKFDENLRWDDKERAVLSACSSLITIVEDQDSRLVQFSHYSVKEFLTSDRLARSTVDTLRYYYIRLEPAHVVMAQVCLSVLLQLSDNMDKQTIRNYSLSDYAGNFLCSHVEFENVISSIGGDGIDNLLDRDKPYLYTWVWLQIGDWDSENWHNSKMTPDMTCSSLTQSYPVRSQYYVSKPKLPPRLPPLYYVAALGHLCLARHLILKYPQDLNVRDDKGWTPLHMAILAGNEGVSQLLIEHSLHLDVHDINKRTPLHMAAYMGLAKATQMLLERGEGLKTRVNARDKNSWTPLHFASQHHHSDIAGLLLKFGANVDAQDNNTTTPLLLVSLSVLPTFHDVSISEATKTVQVLLEYGASVHVRNKNGQMPLHAASHRRLPGIVALLLKFGADVDARDNDSMTPLCLVSQNWDLLHTPSQTHVTKTAQLLLEHGASIHARNKNGQMPLHLASQLGLPSIVALLLKFGADVETRDNYSMTPLLLVLQHPTFFDDNPQAKITEIVQLLLEHGASVHVQNKNRQMPLHLASKHCFSSVVALLLKFGADVEAQDSDSMTPLLLVFHYQSSFGNHSRTKITTTVTVQLLLEHGASVHVRNNNGQMPLHLASQHGLSGIVALLLKFGADVDAQDNDSMTPLLLLSQRPWGDYASITEAAQVLLEHGASVHMRNKDGLMPLHFASQSGFPRMVKLLLKFGADVDARDNSNITPLHFAVSSPFQCGSSVSFSDDSIMPMGVIETIKLLLEHGANLETQNDKGETPIQVALRRGERHMFEVVSDHVQNDQAADSGDVVSLRTSVPHETTYQSTEGSSLSFFCPCLQYYTRILNDAFMTPCR
jgi:ankyrin repeat protein